MAGEDGCIHNGWSRLPQELLVLILKRLSCVCDCIQFGLVCTWWRSVLLETRHLLTHAPLLMIPDKNYGGTRGFFCLSDGGVHRIRLHQAQNKTIFASSSCWVLTTDRTSSYAIYLLNPITGVQIQLPQATTFSNFYRRTWNFTYKRFVKKAVLSSNRTSTHDCIAVAIHGFPSVLSFCRVGDVRWSTFKSVLQEFDDVIYCQGQFYAITMRGEVVLCDVGPDPKLIEVTPPIIADCPNKKYLVESSGELLKVTKLLQFGVDREYRTSKFTIHELNLSTKKWKEVKSLGDRMLFLGFSCSISLPAQEMYGFKGNCIYFLNDFMEGSHVFRHGRYDMGVFDLGDGSIQLFGGSSWLLDSPLLLVMPSPW